MKECIYCYRMNTFALNLYIIAWNNGENAKNNNILIEKNQEEDYLNNCMVLCKMNKNSAKEKIVKQRLERLRLK